MWTCLVGGGGGGGKDAHWVLVRVKQSMRSENTSKQNGDHCHAALQEHAIAHFQVVP